MPMVSLDSASITSHPAASSDALERQSETQLELRTAAAALAPGPELLTCQRV